MFRPAVAPPWLKALGLCDPKVIGRFWRRIAGDRDPDRCWPWRRTEKSGAYGRMQVRGRLIIATHASYMLARMEPIPKGMEVLHRCDNPPCVNPDHLFLGTHAENMADMVAKGRQSRGQEHARNLTHERAKGSANGRAKLTEADAQAIMAAHAEGSRIAELARQYGVSWTAVKFIITQRNWRHVAKEN